MSLSNGYATTKAHIPKETPNIIDVIKVVCSPPNGIINPWIKPIIKAKYSAIFE